jgi:hypothetical protein
MTQVTPYRAPLLGSSAKLCCSACQDVLTGNPKAHVGSICQECGYVTCGKCTPGRAHTRFCERLGFAQMPRLLKRVFAPIDPKGTEEEMPWDDCFLLGFQAVDYIKARFLFRSEEQQQALFERIRSPEAFDELLAQPVGPEPPKGQERPTLAQAAFCARPMQLGADDLGPSNADYLFASLVLMAQPRHDTLAQYAVLWTDMGTTLGARAAAHAAPGAKVRELYKPEVLDFMRCHILELSPEVVDGKHVTIPRGFPLKDGETFIEDGYTFRERLKLELDAHVKRKSLMNVAFYLHFYHTSEDEAHQVTLEGKYKGKRRDDVSMHWPRRASFDMVLRIMGDPQAPRAAVYHSAAGLYSLESWTKGDLHPVAVKRLADPKKANTAADFDLGLRFRPAGTTEAEWHASLLHNWVLAEPPYAGAGERALEAEDLWHFADDVDALLNPQAKLPALRSAYEKLTGIKWPLPMSPFVLTFARADLTL